ncbi:MAG TPA: MOSC N-terminal beta barrel domain-containing protein [Candidatus Binataceae bacterium]|nr:MOSC N-terminal beta barrel domain-containing protein [Candidatus Binataceae bacterium]
MHTDGKMAGAVAAMWRYPVKSMLGEEINSTIVTERGLLGDRAYALVDRTTGKIVSAKNPRKWPTMFAFRAAFAEPPDMGEVFPPVRITMPDGISVMSSHPNLDGLLSRALGCTVTFEAKPPDSPKLEEYWPDVENLAHRETVTEEAMPPGTFFDGAVVHILTTSTLESLQALYPGGRFEARRFRPNLIVAPPGGEKGFIENDWVGCTLAIGSQVRLKVVCATGRCVMTTLAQGDLPRDVGILKTAVQGNGANVGIYASVERGGVVRAGDAVKIEASA